MLEYKFAYLLLDLILLPVWILLFVRRKDLRNKMLIISILIGFVGLIATRFYYSKDYWNPMSIMNSYFLVEDFLFGFIFGGIAGVFYEELFGKKILQRHIRKHNWALFFVMLVGYGSIMANILFLNFGINSIYVSFLSFFITGSGILFFRADLIKDAIISGVLCGIVLFISYLVLLNFYPLIFSAFWQLDNLSGIRIWKIPIEEILWAFGFGMVVGPMYEFYAGLKLKKRMI